jgi:hypothetical protein
MKKGPVRCAPAQNRRTEMTLNELIEELKELREEIAINTGDEDNAGEAEVFMAYQPNYPLQSDVEYVTAIKGDARQACRVYLAAGGDNAYAPSAAWEGGWYEEDKEED